MPGSHSPTMRPVGIVATARTRATSDPVPMPPWVLRRSRMGKRDTRTMPAERDLAALLATLDVERRPGTFAYVQRSPHADSPAGAVAMIDEGTSVTYVVDA